MDERIKKVDIVIPTYKPDERTVLLVKKLLRQSFPVREIHMIDTETGVFPAELNSLGEKVRITHIPREQFDHGGTRHFGAMESRADFVVFMTQDALPANDRLLEELIKPFEDSKVAASYARQLPAADCNLIERYTRSFNYPPQSRVKSMEDLDELGIKTYFCSDVCAAYRKSVYDSLGGFEEKVIFNEDMIMAARMIQSGAKVAYAAQAKVIHSHNYSCIQQLKRNFDLAVSQEEHPEIFEGLRSEDEGIRLVKETACYLVKKGRPWLVVSLAVKSAFKYAGYRLGRMYRRLPQAVILKCTMSPWYWKKEEEKDSGTRNWKEI